MFLFPYSGSFKESLASSAKFQIISPVIFNSVGPNTSDISKLIFSRFSPTMHLTFQPHPATIWINHWTHKANSAPTSPPMYSPPPICRLLSALRDSYTVFKIEKNITHCLYLSPGIIIHSPHVPPVSLSIICMVALTATYYVYALTCLTCLELTWVEWSFYSPMIPLKISWCLAGSKRSSNVCQSA